MEIRAALLCQLASVSEGLLQVGGGGISRLFAPAVPAATALAVAVVIDLEPEAAAYPHEVALTMTAPSSDAIVRGMVAVQVDPRSPLQPGEHSLVPVTIQLPAITFPTYGRYDTTITVDDDKSVVLAIWVLHPSEQPTVTRPGQLWVEEGLL